jgi:hypothetical protein
MGGENVADEVNRTYKDTMYKLIFKETRPFLDLYEFCSGQRLNENEITCFDLDSDIINRARSNDVSFITNDNRMLYLIEHQSTINSNMAVKVAAYFFDLLKLWISTKGIDIHTEKEVIFPKPELYVVYNGKSVYNKDYETYESSDFMRVKVKIKNIRYPVLSNNDPGNYLTGYSYLQYEHESKQLEGWTPKDSFEYAVQQCKQKGYLKGIIEKEDFVIMFNDVFSYDNQLRAEGRAEEKIASAKVMIADGEPIEKIQRYSRLSVEEIEKLIVEFKTANPQ